MSAQAHRSEIKHVRQVIRHVKKALREVHSVANNEAGKERRKLTKRNQVLTRKAAAIMAEWRSNKTRLAELNVKWKAFLRESEELERQLADLSKREQSARELYHQQVNPKRQAATRKAGRASAEKRGEWFANYLSNFTSDMSPALGVELAKKFRWTRLKPDQAAVKFAEWLYEDAENLNLARRVEGVEAKLRKQVEAEEYDRELARQAAMSDAAEPDYLVEDTGTDTPF
jgi:competence CoiA-like predicted nuclease